MKHKMTNITSVGIKGNKSSKKKKEAENKGIHRTNKK